MLPNVFVQTFICKRDQPNLETGERKLATLMHEEEESVILKQFIAVEEKLHWAFKLYDKVTKIVKFT